MGIGTVSEATRRQVFEQYYGRRLMDKEVWRLGINEPDSLSYIAQGAEPRLLEHEHEFAAFEGIRAINDNILASDRVSDSVDLARRVIFEGIPPLDDVGDLKIPPPFSTLADAEAWIAAELGSVEAQAYEETMRRLWDESPDGLWSMDNLLVPKIRSRVPFYFAGIEAQAAWFYFESTNPEIIAAGKKQKGQALRGVPGGMWHSPTPGTVFVPAKTESLALVAVYSGWLSKEVSGCWDKSECAALILVGKTPQLPRWRVWVDNLPGDGKMSVLELYGSFNEREMRAIHGIIRRHTGSYRKKSLTPEDVEILGFVESMPKSEGWTWPKRLDRWNTEHVTNRQYATKEGLIAAYKAAQERRTRS